MISWYFNVEVNFTHDDDLCPPHRQPNAARVSYVSLKVLTTVLVTMQLE